MSFEGVVVLPADSDDQQLIVTWQNPVTRAVYPVGLLEKRDGEYSFQYLKSSEDAQGFRLFPGLERVDRIYKAPRLFDFFSSRVLSPTRPDFETYIGKLDLGRDEATPWELLARSSGRRHGDTVQVFPGPRWQGQTIEFPLLVAGIRYLLQKDVTFRGKTVGHYSRAELEGMLQQLRPGDLLTLAREEKNQQSPYATLILDAHDRPVGYLPDWVAHEFQKHLSVGHASLRVRKVNSREAGWHLRLVVDFSVSASDQEVFTGRQWETRGRFIDEEVSYFAAV